MGQVRGSKLRGLLAGALALALSGGAAEAVPLDAFSSFYVLGDSLSDNGNAYDASFGLVPESPPYWNGRFTNGPNWFDRVARAFRKQGVDTGNFAFGGAKARTDRDGIPDLKVQLGEYAALGPRDIGGRPLVALWAGGNDVLQADGGFRALGKSAADSVGDVARSLARAGVGDIMILNLPDIGSVPSANGSPRESRQATAASRAFNRELDRQVARLTDNGVNVYSVDVHALFSALIAHPRRFGVSNVTTPCLDDDDNPCTPRQERQRAFFDSTHPSTIVHGHIAAAARDALRGGGASGVAIAATTAAAPVTIAPVPLPATGLLLLAGVGGLGLAGFVRRRV